MQAIAEGYSAFGAAYEDARRSSLLIRVEGDGMSGPVYDMTSEETRIFADVISALAFDNGCEDIREKVFPNIMKLLRADILASFVWDPRKATFTQPFFINQSAENIERYQTWYQYRDPLTRKLRELWRPAHVEDVISRHDLTQTEFYNDFLSKDGMSFGVNLFLQGKHRELADLRIWRGPNKVDFGDREIDLLGALAPFLKRALSRRAEQGLDCLTERERDVVNLVARGCTDKEISRILNIGFATVRTHLGNCLIKLDCSNRAELAAFVAKQQRRHES
jgi:DNA-binding CsgD family transcriptional regulator